MRTGSFARLRLASFPLMLITAVGVFAEGGPTQRTSQDLSKLMDYATTRYLAYRREVDRNVSDPLMVPIDIVGKAFGVAWVSCYPVEWLYWEDILRPLQAQGYVPDFVPGYHAAPDASPTLTVFIQYAGGQFVSNRNDRDKRASTSLEIDAFSTPLPEEHAHVWIRSEVREMKSSRACLVVVQAVRRELDGQRGTIRAVETSVLESRHDSREFKWRREDSSWRFIPDHEIAGSQ